MAFKKKTWKDRITEYPTRRTLKRTDGSTELVTVSRAEGNVSQEGDAFSAANMNDLEKRIASEFVVQNNNLTNSLGGLTFGVDADGNYGYIKAGADTVTPFKSGGLSVVGKATNNNSWTINSKRYGKLLTLTGLPGSVGTNGFGVYGVAADELRPEHTLGNLIWSGFIGDGTAVEIDVSGCDRFIVYCVYRASPAGTVYLQIDN